MQRDIHYYATLALAVHAGWDDDEAKLIAWANFMTDCTALTQVKRPWQVFWDNPGPWFHFLSPNPKTNDPVEANSNAACVLVGRGQNNLGATANETLIRLGIALHTYQDTYSHQGFVGKLSRKNEMDLERRWLPPYGHTQMLKIPDRAECTWTDTRTGEIVVNASRFEEALNQTYKFLRKPGSPNNARAIEGIVWERNYDNRKRRWAKAARMPDIRFSAVKEEMWRKHKKEFVAAAKAQRRFLAC